MKLKPYKKDLYKLWDEFWVADDEKAKKLGSAVQKYISSIAEPDAEDHYLWGLSIYSLNQENVLKNSHPLFLKALELDSNYYLARLYSAHCYHDKGEYKKALTEYLKVDQNLLKKEMPIWRWVKLIEQIGYCYIKLGNIPQAESYFESVIDSYLTIEKDSLVPIREAYECLAPDHPLVLRLKDAEIKHFPWLSA